MVGGESAFLRLFYGGTIRETSEDFCLFIFSIIAVDSFYYSSRVFNQPLLTMLFIYGQKTASIKTYNDSYHSCDNCGSFDLQIKVYRKYFHLFFIPALPAGINTSTVRCNNCSAPMRIDSLQRYYEDATKAPIYLYSLLLLFTAPIVLGVILNLTTQNEKAAFVAAPKVGDVYLVREDGKESIAYYFMRVASIHNDTVSTYQTHLQYDGFVSKLQSDDYFDKTEELVFTKAQLKQMLDKDKINAVERGYGDYERFNRIK